MSLPEGQPTMTTTGNDSFWGGFNSALGNAMNIWGKVEEIKAVRGAQGLTQQDHMNTAELDNGAAVLVDAPKTQTAQPAEPLIMGVPQKTLLLGAGGLLVAIIAIKVIK